MQDEITDEIPPWAETSEAQIPERWPNPTSQTLHLIPLPGPSLTREMALDWLQEWSQDYAFIVTLALGNIGIGNFPKEAILAFEMLALDLGFMLGACAKVLSHGKPVTLMHDDDGEPEQTEHWLALIVANRDPDTSGDTAYDELAKELLRRISERKAESDARREQERAQHFPLAQAPA